MALKMKRRKNSPFYKKALGFKKGYLKRECQNSTLEYWTFLYLIKIVSKIKRKGVFLFFTIMP